VTAVSNFRIQDKFTVILIIFVIMCNCVVF